MEPNTTNSPIQTSEQNLNQSSGQNQKPVDNSVNTTVTHTHDSIGPIVGSLIIVILLIIAALYIWTQKVPAEDMGAEQNSAQMTQEEQLTPAQATAVQETGLDIEVEELEDLNF